LGNYKDEKTCQYKSVVNSSIKFITREIFEDNRTVGLFEVRCALLVRLFEGEITLELYQTILAQEVIRS
jgi:hypothetical protein